MSNDSALPPSITPPQSFDATRPVRTSATSGGKANGARPSGPVPTGPAPAGQSFGPGAAPVAGSTEAPAASTATAGEPAQLPAAETGPRRVRLAISRVDPWSVMKLSFLLSVAIGIMIVVAAAVVWGTLDSLHVFTSVNDTLIGIVGPESSVTGILEVFEFDRVMSAATFIAVIDVVILTALSTIMAFLYNITAALVGGLHVTLTDD